MIRKLTLTIIILLVLSPIAWSVTTHTDYGTSMEIKYCNECHIGNNVEPNHGEFWMKEHKLYKHKLPNNCADCHQQSFCLDCHKGGGIDQDLHVSNSGVDYMPKSHRSDFRELHPIKAKESPRSCYRCHDSEKFCAQCHDKFNRNDLRLESHRRGWTDLDLKLGGPTHALFTPLMCQTCHPNGMLPKNQWSGAHAREARKNLASCQSCHADGDVCLKCHSAISGLKVNPHPRNWSKISGRLKNAGNNRTCVKCHLQ
ncbi:MAG: cytochrome C [Nitrospirae bacterium]|nr:cytochrome C [Nitrospirota bacterium]